MNFYNRQIYINDTVDASITDYIAEHSLKTPNTLINQESLQGAFGEYSLLMFPEGQPPIITKKSFGFGVLGMPLSPVPLIQIVAADIIPNPGVIAVDTLVQNPANEYSIAIEIINNIAFPIQIVGWIAYKLPNLLML